ncbi:MAG TPA: L-rhamnose/proton symporter RhaT [Bryobacteraceae bacterium]
MNVAAGAFYALGSGICNGLFTAPMKIIPRWKWEHIWLVFIVTACLIMPAALVFSMTGDPRPVYAAAPAAAVRSALLFGFAWGFGAILFGLSVDSLGVSLANSLVIGLSSALGSVVPLIVQGVLKFEARQIVLFAGVLVFVLGVALCGAAGRLREGVSSSRTIPARRLRLGYAFSSGSGILSAIFNVGYSLALPIADTGVRAGLTHFEATNTIWMLMLGAGSIPNIWFCAYLMRKNRNAGLFSGPSPHRTWGLSMAMGLLWGGSIFLYGLATPQLGDIGPSIGWPLSLAAGLLVANLMGVLLGEWRHAPPASLRLMRFGIGALLAAICVCAYSTRIIEP